MWSKYWCFLWNLKKRKGKSFIAFSYFISTFRRLIFSSGVVKTPERILSTKLPNTHSGIFQSLRQTKTLKVSNIFNRKIFHKLFVFAIIEKITELDKV